jgi:hypothetical protein
MGHNMVKSAAQTHPVLDSSSLAPVLNFPAELASILLLTFLLFTLVAALSQCLCSENPYLSIKLYHIYVCYTNIVFGITVFVGSHNCGRSWNILVMDMGAHLYFGKKIT